MRRLRLRSIPTGPCERSLPPFLRWEAPGECSSTWGTLRFRFASRLELKANTAHRIIIDEGSLVQTPRLKSSRAAHVPGVHCAAGFDFRLEIGPNLSSESHTRKWLLPPFRRWSAEWRCIAAKFAAASLAAHASASLPALN